MISRPSWGSGLLIVLGVSMVAALMGSARAQDASDPFADPVVIEEVRRILLMHALSRPREGRAATSAPN